MSDVLCYQGFASATTTPYNYTPVCNVPFTEVAAGRYSVYCFATFYSNKLTIAQVNFVLAINVNGDNPTYDSQVGRSWTNGLVRLEGCTMLNVHGATELWLPNATNSVSAQCGIATGTEGSLNFKSALMFRLIKTFYVKSV